MKYFDSNTLAPEKALINIVETKNKIDYSKSDGNIFYIKDILNLSLLRNNNLNNFILSNNGLIDDDIHFTGKITLDDANIITKETSEVINKVIDGNELYLKLNGLSTSALKFNLDDNNTLSEIIYNNIDGGKLLFNINNNNLLEISNSQIYSKLKLVTDSLESLSSINTNELIANDITAKGLNIEKFNIDTLFSNKLNTTDILTNNISTDSINTKNIISDTSTIKDLESTNIINENLKTNKIDFDTSIIKKDGDNISIINEDGSYGTLNVGNLNIFNKINKVTNTELIVENDNKITLKNLDSANNPIGNIGLLVNRGNKINASFIWDENNEFWKIGKLGAEEKIITSLSSNFENSVYAPFYKFNNEEDRYITLNQENNILIKSEFLYLNSYKVLTEEDIGKSIISTESLPSIDIGNYNDLPFRIKDNSVFIATDTGQILVEKSGKWTDILKKSKFTVNGTQMYNDNLIFNIGNGLKYSLDTSVNSLLIELDKFTSDYVIQDDNHLFTTKDEKTLWNNKVNNSDLYSNIYTKQEVDNRIQNVVGAAPEALDTLQELANSLKDDQDFAGTMTTSLSKKVDKVDGYGLTHNDFTDFFKDKLTNIEAFANNYIHPSTHPATMIVEDGDHNFVTVTEKNNWADKYTKQEITNMFATGTIFNANKLNNKDPNYYLDYNNFANIPTKVSQFANDSDYIRADQAPIQTVNGYVGTVKLNKNDIGLNNVTNDPQIKRSEMNVANGVATLDSNKKVVQDTLTLSGKSIGDFALQKQDNFFSGQQHFTLEDQYYNFEEKVCPISVFGNIAASEKVYSQGQELAQKIYIDNILGSAILNTTNKTVLEAINELKDIVSVGGQVDNANKLNGLTADKYMRTDIDTSTSGNLTIGKTLTIKKQGTVSTIAFPAQTNDPGYIKHIENNDNVEMRFCVSDDNTTNDKFSFGYGIGDTFTEVLSVNTSGNLKTNQINSTNGIITGNYKISNNPDLDSLDFEYIN